MVSQLLPRRQLLLKSQERISSFAETKELFSTTTITIAIQADPYSFDTDPDPAFYAEYQLLPRCQLVLKITRERASSFAHTRESELPYFAETKELSCFQQQQKKQLLLKLRLKEQNH